MKTKFSFLTFTMTIMAFSVLFVSCKTDEPVVEDTRKEVANEVIIDADITGTRNFVKDSVYVLYGQINVSGTLNIAAGTVIKGEKASKGSLIILRGGKIYANGTASSPVVFTSRMKPGLRAAGDWGGLVIVGNAPVNQTSPVVEGLSREVSYGGGTDAADNSGKLQYVRIEFAGIALQPDKEINGLTLCAVGSGTVIDHVQVSYCGDDSFEWFGGTVNAKYLIAYLGLDDEFDTDYGFSGKVQFALGVRNARNADVSLSNGFESDNDGNGTAATPQTSAVFSNVTLVGPYKTTADKNVNANYGVAMHIRRNSSISVFNSVFAGWNTGLLLDGTSTYANTTAGNLVVQNCALVGIKTSNVKGATITDDQALSFFNTANAGNSIITTNVLAGIETSFYDASKTGTAAIPISFLPTTGSALLSGAAFTHTKVSGAFFTPTTYIGAFGTTNWTKESWTNFDPQNTAY